MKQSLVQFLSNQHLAVLQALVARHGEPFESECTCVAFVSHHCLGARDESRIELKAFKGPNGEDRPVMEVAVCREKFNLLKHAVGM